jgi:hypothetical protein
MSTRPPRLCAVASDSVAAAATRPAARTRDSNQHYVRLADIVYQFVSPSLRRSGARHLQNVRARGVHSPMPLATMLPMTLQT